MKNQYIIGIIVICIILFVLISVIMFIIYEYYINYNYCNNNDECNPGYMCSSNKCVLAPNPTTLDNVFKNYYYNNGTNCIPCSSNKAVGLNIINNSNTNLSTYISLYNDNNCTNNKNYYVETNILPKSVYYWYNNIINNKCKTIFEKSTFGINSNTNKNIVEIDLTSISNSYIISGDIINIILNPYIDNSTYNVFCYKNNETLPFYSTISSNYLK